MENNEKTPNCWECKYSESSVFMADAVICNRKGMMVGVDAEGRPKDCPLLKEERTERKRKQIEAAAAIIKEALAAIDRAKAMIVDGTDAAMCSSPAEKSYCWPWERDYHAQVYHGIDLIAEAAGLEVETHSTAELGLDGESVYKVLNIGELTLFEIQ